MRFIQVLRNLWMTIFKKFSKEIKNFISKNKIKNPSIVEIGSNDGIMLKRFKNYQHLGIEPAKNVALECKKKITVMF